MNNEISVCMMSEDEEKFIQLCLDSIYDVADEIIVLMDCHVKDKTREIAEKCDKVRIYVNHYSGDFHFSDGRNQSLRKAKKYWSFVMDADEEMISDQKECRDFIQSAPLMSIIPAECLQVSGTSTYARLDQPRVFPTRKGVKYKGHVHNQPVFENKDLRLLQHSPIRIKHNGFADPEKRKKRIARTKQNIGVTMAKVEAGKGGMGDYYNLVKMLQMVGDVGEAVKMGMEGFKIFKHMEPKEQKKYERFLLALSKAMMLSGKWDLIDELLHIHMYVVGETVDGTFLRFFNHYRKGWIIGAYIYGVKFLELWKAERMNVMSMQQYIMYEPIVREKMKFIQYAMERKIEV